MAKAVIPGDYAIYVEIGSRFNPEDKRERELGYVPIRIDSGDVEGSRGNHSQARQGRGPGRIRGWSARKEQRDDAGQRCGSRRRPSAR